MGALEEVWLLCVLLISTVYIIIFDKFEYFYDPTFQDPKISHIHQILQDHHNFAKFCKILHPFVKFQHLPFS
jgi:hypothetical protein